MSADDAAGARGAHRGASHAASSPRNRWTCRARRCTRTAASRRVTSCCACSPRGTARRTRCCRADSRAWPPASKSLVVSMQAGGGSKDTWVIGGADDTAYELEPSPQPSFTSSTELSSRMADNLFWLGRYAERLEANARLFRVLLPGTLRRAAAGAARLGGHGAALPARPRPAAAAVAPRHRGAPVVEPAAPRHRHGVRHPRTWSSIGGNLRHVRRLSWEVKERLSPDTWRVLQQLSTPLLDDAADQPRSPLPGRARRARRRRDHAVGVRRAAGREPDARLRLALPEPRPPHGARAADARAAARRRGASRRFPTTPISKCCCRWPTAPPPTARATWPSIRTRYVLELLLADETNPRSVAFQAAALLDGVHSLPRQPGRGDAAGRVHAGQAAAPAAARRQHGRDQAARRQRPAPGARSAPADACATASPISPTRSPRAT